MKQSVFVTPEHKKTVMLITNKTRSISGKEPGLITFLKKLIKSLHSFKVKNENDFIRCLVLLKLALFVYSRNT